MLNNVIDPVTGQPRKLGELFSDRNIRLVGEMRWDSAVNKVDTRNMRIISTPNDGGSPAITVIPDGSYTLSAANTSIWIELRRTAGTTTVVLGTSLIADVSSQQKPRPNWIQLFLRTSTNDIVTLGNWLVLSAPQWTKAGVTRGTSIYDAIVGNATNPFATHTTIQGAIDDALDGDRILVLSGEYNLSGPGNSVVDASASLSWSGKTLTLEGEGYNTVLRNTGSLTRAFGILSTSPSSNASFGSGSRIINMHLKNYRQTVRFDGGVNNGVRHCFVDVYSTAVSSYVAPAKTGTGTFAANVVQEQLVSGSTYSGRETVVGADIVTDVKTESTTVLSSTGLRYISVQNSLRLGDTNAPTQELDVVGNIRTTTGFLHTSASSMNIVNDTGSSQNLKAKTLVLSDSLADVASSQQLLVQGKGNISSSLQVGGLASITSIMRTSNIVTITTSAAHGYYPGAQVTVAAVANTTVNGTFTVASIPSATTFTYSQTGTNLVSTISTGTVRADLSAAQTTEVIGSLSFSSQFTTRALTNVQANYSVADHDYIVVASGSSTFTITLPTIQASNRGRHVIVKSTNSSSFIQIVASASQTIDGSVNPVLVGQYEAINFVSDGTSGWLIV